MFKSLALATVAFAAASTAFAQGSPATPPSAPASAAQPSASQPSASMIPPPATSSTTSTTTTSAPAPAGAAGFTQITPNPASDIVATLKASGQFTTLLKATDATQLTAILQKPGAITVFAPTDAAFAALPAGTLANLMQPANSAKLQHILAYHVVNAKVTTDQLKGHAAGPVPTVAGPPLTVDGSADTITVNGNPVLQAGVPASNGVIYVVGSVLMPPS